MFSPKGGPLDFTPLTHKLTINSGQQLPKSAFSSQTSMGHFRLGEEKDPQIRDCATLPTTPPIPNPSHSFCVSATLRSGRLEMLKLCEAPRSTTALLWKGGGGGRGKGRYRKHSPHLSVSPCTAALLAIFVRCLLMRLPGSETLCPPCCTPIRATALKRSPWTVTDLCHRLRSAPCPDDISAIS